MQQPDQYLEHPDLSTPHHSSRTFTGCLSIGESCKRSLHYVILHYLALALALRHQQESDCFKRALKTHMFSLS